MTTTGLSSSCASLVIGLVAVASFVNPLVANNRDRALSLSWDHELLTIRGDHLPGKALEVWYLEAFCRPGSTTRDWKETVISHTTNLVAASPDGRSIKLQSTLSDGVRVDHEIRAGDDEVEFRLIATNPTAVESQAHWAQPCIRVEKYAGIKRESASEAYLPRCFVYVDGKPARMPTTPWANQARYTPGQVWCPDGVSRDDVNPRPQSSIVPSNGLIGCVSADGTELMATAWEPYQELFQGVIVCLHSDFRIGGLKPGETKTIRGKIYLMPADFPALRARYRRDFPGQDRPAPAHRLAPPPKRLIEFGWDEPDTSFIRQERAQLEQTPFDGSVFHVATRGAGGTRAENFTWLCWGKRRFAEADLEVARADLASIKSTEFRHNFLRFNVTPADIDWFGDHDAVVSNARLAARLAHAAGCDGILLDTEAYQGKLFDYHHQRDSVRRPWAEYQAQARLRGREVMAAFQQEFPNLTLLVTFGHSLVWKESSGGTKPLSTCPNGLLVTFLDGMIDAAAGQTRLVDGHELSYGYRDPPLFVRAREVIKIKAAALAADPVKYRSVVAAGFGLWLDFNWPKYGWKTDKVESNYFSPERFELSLRAAVEQADQYVWIYTEKPRWWSRSGKGVDLPVAYIEAVRRVRRALLDE
jgi:hypothetical protein